MTTLKTDGNEYHIITESCIVVRDVPGMICEIGSYMGGGMKLLMDSFVSMNQKHRIFISIDPYGDIIYTDINGPHRAGYTNKVKNEFLKQIYEVCSKEDLYFIQLQMTDYQFFSRFSDGIPVYRDFEKIETEYALVVLDGPHNYDVVRNEFSFFCNKISKDGIIIFDDINQYNHMLLEPDIFNGGFKLIFNGNYKRAYQKII